MGRFTGETEKDPDLITLIMKFKTAPKKHTELRLRDFNPS